MKVKHRTALPLPSVFALNRKLRRSEDTIRSIDMRFDHTRFAGPALLHDRIGQYLGITVLP